jgi:hypothetical protein
MSWKPSPHKIYYKRLEYAPATGAKFTIVKTLVNYKRKLRKQSLVNVNINKKYSDHSITESSRFRMVIFRTQFVFGFRMAAAILF